MRGRLAIGCFVTFAPLYMPNLIMRFTTDHPGTELRLSEGYHDELFEGLESGALEPGRIVIAHPAGARLTRLARTFVDYAAAWFQKMA